MCGFYFKASTWCCSRYSEQWGRGTQIPSLNLMLLGDIDITRRNEEFGKESNLR